MSDALTTLLALAAVALATGLGLSQLWLATFGEGSLS